MGKFELLLNRMDALTGQRMGVTIHLNGQPVRAVEFHFLSEMGPISGDGISYVIFTSGITPRRNDSVTVNGDTFIVTRILCCNGKPHIFIESE